MQFVSALHCTHRRLTPEKAPTQTCWSTCVSTRFLTVVMQFVSALHCTWQTGGLHRRGPVLKPVGAPVHQHVLQLSSRNLFLPCMVRDKQAAYTGEGPYSNLLEHLFINTSFNCHHAICFCLALYVTNKRLTPEKAPTQTCWSTCLSTRLATVITQFVSALHCTWQTGGLHRRGPVLKPVGAPVYQHVLQLSSRNLFLPCIVRDKQAAYTGEGPYSNLLEHLFNPFGANIVTKLLGLD